jgi:hypothetical protein
LTLLDRLRSSPRVLLAARAGFWIACAVVAGAAVIPSEDHPPDLFGWDKANHFVAFYGVALIGALAFPRLSVLVLGAWLSGLGALIEVIQAIPMLHRDADVLDWVTDSAGILAALAPLAVAAWRAGFERASSPSAHRP